MRLVLARVNKLRVLLAQGDEPVIEVVLQAMQLGLPLQHARRPHGKREREERGHHKLAHRNQAKPTSCPQARHERRRHHGQPASFEPCSVVARQRNDDAGNRRQRAQDERGEHKGQGRLPMPIPHHLKGGACANGNQHRNHACREVTPHRRRQSQAGPKHQNLVSHSLHEASIGAQRTPRTRS